MIQKQGHAICASFVHVRCRGDPETAKSLLNSGVTKYENGGARDKMIPVFWGGKVLRFIIFLALGLGAFATFGEEVSTEGESKLKVGEVLENKKFSEDRRITDIELKAQAGSLSRYSLKFDLSYSGPPVDNLSNPEMPNPDNRARPNRTGLGGYMGGRYRLSSQEALNLSTGLKWFTPYHQIAGERVEKRPTDKDYEIANPQLSYDRTYAWIATQFRSSLKVGLTTSDYYQDRGQEWSVGFAQSAKYTVLGSRFVLGGVVDFDLYNFSRDYNPETDGRISNYVLSMIPSLEYKLSDTVYLRTSVAYVFNNFRLRQDWWLWDENLVSQRVGLGWAITRDIYFSPYLNFFPERPAIRTTSMSFSTVYSIF